MFAKKTDCHSQTNVTHSSTSFDVQNKHSTLDKVLQVVIPKNVLSSPLIEPVNSSFATIYSIY